MQPSPSSETVRAPRLRWSSMGRAYPFATMQAMENGVSTTALDPNTDERFVPLRRNLGVTSFGINQILLRPGQRGRIHRHRDQEEVYLVLAGTLTLIVEGDARGFGQGELVRVAPSVRRQMV